MPKENDMLPIKVRATVLTAALVLLVAGSAKASTIEARVPFPFVVGGQTLPAGEYRVADDGTGIVQIVGERNNHVGMYAMTVPADGRDPAGEKPSLTFKRGETLYRLSGIWESDSRGRAIALK